MACVANASNQQPVDSEKPEKSFPHEKNPKIGLNTRHLTALKPFTPRQVFWWRESDPMAQSISPRKHPHPVRVRFLARCSQKTPSNLQEMSSIFFLGNVALVACVANAINGLLGLRQHHFLKSGLWIPCVRVCITVLSILPSHAWAGGVTNYSE